ncbi:MAG: glycerate kinase [Robiginitalea sp.]|uniref:glycerate kinase family protein n=1 Tax=Robiginitalea sp. TaxID=1902411 RepID=UPI003C781EDE
MRIALIPDKFKGSLTAAEVCDAMEAGIRAVYPGAEIRRFAASDGGDGFLEAVRAVRPMEVVQVPVPDPIGREITASFLHDPKTGEAYIEMARASGMELLSPGERNPMRTDTRGTGELILKAVRLGARHIFVGLGGSGTNDGGCGLASIFGYRFLDSDQQALLPVGGNLERIAHIVPPEDLLLPRSVRITAVYDVNNPLWGPQGAAQVYAAQKGASPEDIQRLDAGLQNLEERVREQLGIDAGHLPGAGAAGGTAFGLKCFLGADFTSGTDLVLRLNGFAQYLDGPKTDYVFTGEGRIDTQTLNGKLIQGVLQLASAQKCPVVAVCGKCDAPMDALSRMGFEAVLEVSDPQKSLAYAMEHAHELVADSVQGFLSPKK